MAGKCARGRWINGPLSTFDHRPPTWALPRKRHMTDQHLNADAAFVFLRDVCTRVGADAAVQAAQDMIAAWAAWIAQERGSDEACRILQVVEATQREGY
jgi:hypothetical protein